MRKIVKRMSFLTVKPELEYLKHFDSSKLRGISELVSDVNGLYEIGFGTVRIKRLKNKTI